MEQRDKLYLNRLVLLHLRVVVPAEEKDRLQRTVLGKFKKLYSIYKEKRAAHKGDPGKKIRNIKGFSNC